MTRAPGQTVSDPDRLSSDQQGPSAVDGETLSAFITLELPAQCQPDRVHARVHTHTFTCCQRDKHSEDGGCR